MKFTKTNKTKPTKEGDPKMKINKAELKKINAMELTEAVEEVNALGVGPKIKMKQSKADLAKALIEKVQKVSDAGHRIPDGADSLVALLTGMQSEAEKAKAAAEAEKARRGGEPSDEDREQPPSPPEWEEEPAPAPAKPSKKGKKAKAEAEKAREEQKPIDMPDEVVPIVEEKPKRKLAKAVPIPDGGTITVVEEKAPKNPETKAYKVFQLYRKHKTVANFLKKSGWDRPRAALAFDRYHGRIRIE